jgi:cell division septation protein DedD
MARKENADALAEILRRLSFPVFVFDRGSDGLYRVDVGPYPDADYAHDVRDELASAGFKTVLKRQLAQ